MTLEATHAALVPQWWTVRSERLGRDVQVRRPTVADASSAPGEIWARLVRDADGTPLLPPNLTPSDCDAEVAAEIIHLATARPTPAPG